MLAVNMKTLKKEHILEAGLEIMYQQGYNGTSVKDIVDAAGVPKGSFYNYFESKESFVIEGMEFLALSGFEEMRKALEGSEDGALDRLLSFFEEKMEAALAEGFYGGCFLSNICQEMSDCCEPIRLKAKALFHRRVEYVADFLKKGQEKGLINPDLEPRDAAEYFFSSWAGALLQVKADRSAKPFQVFLAHSRLLLNA